MADYTYSAFKEARIGDDIHEVGVAQPMWRTDASEYERVRLGNLAGGIKFTETLESRIRIVQRFNGGGWKAGFPRDIPRDLLKHVAKFRATLDLYEQLVRAPVFSKEEIYIRCLQEGPSFTEYIKKSRSTSLRFIASETITDCAPEYTHPEYNGYDSIFHERYLIPWDDRSEIDDIKYSFLPFRKELDTEFFRMIFRDFLEHIHVVKEDFAHEIDLLAELNPTVAFDPTLPRQRDGRPVVPTRMVREVWNKDVRTDEPYLARRSVVLTTPGSTRDALTATPGTLLKIKQITKLARVISERSPYSCNAPDELSKNRYQRVLQRYAFLHLDFKKYGLTFPRQLNNVALQEIARIADVDLSDLDLTDFFIEIDGVTYRSERGTALGWLDCLSQHCVTALLLYLQREVGVTFDHVGFNDDFELGFWNCGDYRSILNLTRELLFKLFDDWEIPLSADKIYGSRASVFLEKYFFFEESYGLDMEKRQLALGSYASSLLATYPWEAKMFFDIAYSQLEFKYGRDRCIATCPIEFCSDEVVMPIQAGGWLWSDDSTLNNWLNQADSRFKLLGSLLRQWEPPSYSTKFIKGDVDKIRENVYQRTSRATTSDFYRHVVDNPGTLDDINVESAGSSNLAFRWAQGYTGRRHGLVEAVERFVFMDPHCAADDSIT